MISWTVARLALKPLGGFLVRHWRLVALAIVALLIGLYIRSAEQAKRTLVIIEARAELAESMIRVSVEESARLTGEIDALKDSAVSADSAYRAALVRARRPRLAANPLSTSNPADTTRETPDTLDVFDLPEVQKVLKACELRVTTRDAIILHQDRRHVEDSLTIAKLRIISPVNFAPVRPPSRLIRVAKTAAIGAAASLASHYATGGKGSPAPTILVGTSVGALIGLIR